MLDVLDVFGVRLINLTTPPPASREAPTYPQGPTKTHRERHLINLPACRLSISSVCT